MAPAHSLRQPMSFGRCAVDEQGFEWGYYHRLACENDGRRFVGPDGRTRTTGGEDGTIRFWDSAAVTRLAFFAKGTGLAAAGADGTICFWDPKMGQEVGRFGFRSRFATCPSRPTAGWLRSPSAAVPNAKPGIAAAQTNTSHSPGTTRFAAGTSPPVAGRPAGPGPPALTLQPAAVRRKNSRRAKRCQGWSSTTSARRPQAAIRERK